MNPTNIKPFIYIGILAVIAVGGLGYHLMPEKYAYQPSSVLEDVPNTSSTPVVAQPVTPQNPNPVVNPTPTPEPIACTMDAMMCPDGSYVGRSGPNCQFVCPNNSQLETRLVIRAREVLSALSNKDYVQLENLVSSAGLSINNNPHLDLTKNNVSKEFVSEISTDSKKYLWGYTDGKGDPINLTTKEFIDQYIFSEKFLKTDVVRVNEIKDGGTNSVNTILGDINGRTFVTVHYSGDPEYPGMSWMTIYLVFDQENGFYTLRGIARNQWSI